MTEAQLKHRLLAVAGLIALTTAISGHAAPSRQQATSKQLSYGLYMTRAADCKACHTSPGGTPFAGGLEIHTPFGMITSPNITPDPDTGIGRWTDAEFYRALHDGIGRHGEYLYPAMPFPSFTKMTRKDVLAIKQYLFSLKPVFAPRAPSAMDFPFNIRSTMLAWRALYFRPGTFRPNPKHSAAWNRGAYLVQGPGHCGACHSPRNLLGATETSASLAGGSVGRWLAPNISSNPLAGLGDRSIDQIVDFLKSGANTSMGKAFGPMALVVHDSLRYLTQSDLRAIAVYLKEGPDRTRPKQLPDATQAELRRGGHLFMLNCSSCHQDNGRGIPHVVPNLSDNAVVAEFRPHDMLVAMLKGLKGTGGYATMPAFAGALSDKDISDIANYVRVTWGNRGVPDVKPSMVAHLRAIAGVGPAGTESARAFDCPKVGAAAVPRTLARPSEVKALAEGGDADMGNKIHLLIEKIRKEQPGISNAGLSNTIVAAFCPVVANNAALSNSQKRAELMRFTGVLQDQLRPSPPPNSAVIMAVPLASDTLKRIDAAAASSHLTPAQWMAKTLADTVNKTGAETQKK